MNKYILLITNHDSLYFLFILANDSLNYFKLKHARIFLSQQFTKNITEGSSLLSLQR